MKTEATKTNLIHTVGHSNLSTESLVGMLKRRGIAQVIDVRSTPYSRYVPQFNQNNIRATLERNGTGYTHMGDALGGRPQDDRLYDRDGRANYELMAQEKTFQDGVQQVERMAENSHIALMCTEADPLSWSVEDQGEIDRALEAVWRPIVEEAPLPPSHVDSTIASGVLSKLAERYFEQGIPYVIPHPARLYMAHPKWPQTASEPLDERARYYCERDVGRHLRLWTDAASSKGLVQFPVPNDANMYHPQYRDDWPRPLHSSHEEDSTDRIPGHPVATEEVVSSRGSKQSVNAEH